MLTCASPAHAQTSASVASTTAEPSAEAASLNGGVREQLARHDREQAAKDSAYRQARADYEAKVIESERQRAAADAALARWKEQTALAEADRAAWARKYDAPAQPEKPHWNVAPKSHRATCNAMATGSLVRSDC